MEENLAEEVSRLREQIEDIQAKASQITPSGGG